MRRRFVAWGTVPVVAVALAAGGCGSSDKVSSKDRADFVSGCSSSGGAATPTACGCIFDELKKQGYDTKSKFEGLQKKLKAGQRPASFVDTARKCVGK